MTNSMKSICLAAAISGMLGGVSTSLQAQPVNGNTPTVSALAGVHSFANDKKPKHACKGQNACKGQGADGKNDCKGKGSCATDGSKPKL
jgi:hypothetical protein